MPDASMANCSDCGEEFPLYDSLVNNCPECGAPTEVVRPGHLEPEGDGDIPIHN